MPTDDYFRALDATRAHHARSKTFSGRYLFRYAPDVKWLVGEFRCRTLLDYGCGKGVQWVREMPTGGLLQPYLGVDVTKYDPGWPEFSAGPSGQYDIVICTQVLGSIPISDLPWVVDRLYSLARNVVFVGERLKTVRKEVHAHMVGLMPHGWTHEQWARALRRESGVACYLRTKDDSGEGHIELLERVA